MPSPPAPKVIFESANRPATPTVSILTTVYNREAYLEASIQSTLESSYGDLELILLDDCSKDCSLEIAISAAKNDHRVRVYQNSCNLGDYGNRNAATSLATGKYLKFVDSDDIIYRYSLAIMVEAMNSNPEAALGLCHSLPEDEAPYPWKLTPIEAYRKNFLGRGCLGSGPSGVIMRADLFRLLGGFKPAWGVLADLEMWLRLAAKYPMLLLPPGLVWWRRHEGQEFTSNSAATKYISNGFALSRHALSSPDCPLSTSENTIAIRKAKRRFRRNLLSLAIRQRQPFLAVKLFKESYRSNEKE